MLIIRHFYIQVRESDRQDLTSISLVSKAFNSLAKPLLYRSIFLSPAKWRVQNWRRQRAGQRFARLLVRLLDDSNTALRGFVWEVTLGQFDWDDNHLKTVESSKRNNILATLVNLLPNLQLFK
jgi:hypothetical protein